MSTITPSQTVGPFFAYGLTPNGQYPWTDLVGNDLLAQGLAGTGIRIEGSLRDGDGAPVPDGIVEIWQADGDGRFALRRDPAGNLPNTNFKGFGRCATDSAGNFSFNTVKPGVIEGAGDGQAPHVLVAVFARGLLAHAFTRIYFDDEVTNATDPVLLLVPAKRRQTLIARQQIGSTAYRFDIRLQGDEETVFFDI